MPIYLKDSTFLSCMMQSLYLTATAYLLALLLVTVSNSFNVMVARGQQSMEVPALRSEDPHTPIQYNDGANNGLSSLVPHDTANSFMDLEKTETEEKNKYSECYLQLSLKILFDKNITHVEKCFSLLCCYLPPPTYLGEPSCSQPTVWPAARQEGTNSSQCTL